MAYQWLAENIEAETHSDSIVIWEETGGPDEPEILAEFSFAQAAAVRDLLTDHLASMGWDEMVNENLYGVFSEGSLGE